MIDPWSHQQLAEVCGGLLCDLNSDDGGDRKTANVAGALRVCDAIHMYQTGPYCTTVCLNRLRNETPGTIENRTRVDHAFVTQKPRLGNNRVHSLIPAFILCFGRTAHRSSRLHLSFTRVGSVREPGQRKRRSNLPNLPFDSLHVRGKMTYDQAQFIISAHHHVPTCGATPFWHVA